MGISKTSRLLKLLVESGFREVDSRNGVDREFPI